MMPLPRHLRPLARVDQRSATAVHCHLRLHGEAWLQLWFYGSLINNTVQPLADNPADSVRLVAATPAGASALFFDGSQHGYEAVFCEHHAHAAPAQTRLWRYSDDVYRIHLQLGYTALILPPRPMHLPPSRKMKYSSQMAAGLREWMHRPTASMRSPCGWKTAKVMCGRCLRRIWLNGLVWSKQ